MIFFVIHIKLSIKEMLKRLKTEAQNHAMYTINKKKTIVPLISDYFANLYNSLRHRYERVIELQGNWCGY